MSNMMNVTFGIDFTVCTAPSGRTGYGGSVNLGLKPQAISPYSFAVSPGGSTVSSGGFAAFFHSFAATFLHAEV